MKGSNRETVLCASVDSLPGHWLPEYGTVTLTESALLDTLASIEPVWRDRRSVESDETYRQWIPYVLVQNPHGELALYCRRGTEPRLHGRWSVGIGGHINPSDLQRRTGLNRREIWHQALWAGMRRELEEEMPGLLPDGEPRFLGLIHERMSAVGRVHIGVVFLCRTAGPPPAAGEELGEVRWRSPDSIGGPSCPLDHFELWSRLALQLLKEVSRQEGPSSGQWAS